MMKRMTLQLLLLFPWVLHASDQNFILAEFSIASASLQETLPVRVYSPREINEGVRLPVVYMLLGQVFLAEQSGFSRYLDEANIPAIFVAVPLPGVISESGASIFQVEGDRWNSFARFVAFELPSAIHERFAASSVHRMLGFSVGAVMSLDIATNHPGFFDRVAAISPGWMNWDPQRESIGDNYTGRAIGQLQRNCDQVSLDIWINWGDGNGDWERLSRSNGIPVIEALRECGAHVETGGMVAGDHGLHLIPPSLASAIEFLLR